MPEDDAPNEREADAPEHEDASKTRHTHPAEDTAGWKAASEAAKDEAEDPHS
jgi:hypothetical protein